MLATAAVPLIGMLTLLAFWAGIQTNFVSGAWLFLGWANAPDLAVFVPSTDPAAWNYRPLVYAAFLIEYRLFGLEPLGYHLVAFAGHAMAAGLLGLLAVRLSGQQVAGIVAALLFLFSPAAHEPVFDVADLHNALSAPLIVGALVASLARRGTLAMALAFLAFGVDENAVLILPLALIMRGSWRGIAIVTAGYILLRVLGPGFRDEGGSCRTLECLWTGTTMYATRFAPFLIGAVTLAALVRRPVQRPSVFAFALAFAVLAGGLSLVMLYPYVADRFMYLPSMGLALFVGFVAAELRGWRLQVAAAGVAVLLVLGTASLADRGRGWAEAGRLAQAIVAETVRTNPNPVLLVIVAPATLEGRHGGISDPFVFHQGLPAALAFAYGHPVEVVVQRP